MECMSPRTWPISWVATWTRSVSQTPATEIMPVSFPCCCPVQSQLHSSHLGLNISSFNKDNEDACLSSSWSACLPESSIRGRQSESRLLAGRKHEPILLWYRRNNGANRTANSLCGWRGRSLPKQRDTYLRIEKGSPYFIISALCKRWWITKDRYLLTKPSPCMITMPLTVMRIYGGALSPLRGTDKAQFWLLCHGLTHMEVVKHSFIHLELWIMLSMSLIIYSSVI